LADRVVPTNHDNRDGRGRRLRSGDGWVVGCHDDFHIAANEVSGATSVPRFYLLHDNVLAFDPAEPTQALLPRLDLVRDRPSNHPDASNSRRRLLRLGGERRGEEARSQGADERSSVHTKPSLGRFV
jgi:hypothetical protein